MKVAIVIGDLYEETSSRDIPLEDIRDFINVYIKQAINCFGIPVETYVDKEDDDEEVLVIDLPILAGKTGSRLLLSLLAVDLDDYILSYIEDNTELLEEVEDGSGSLY